MVVWEEISAASPRGLPTRATPPGVSTKKQIHRNGKRSKKPQGTCPMITARSGMVYERSRCRQRNVISMKLRGPGERAASILLNGTRDVDHQPGPMPTPWWSNAKTEPDWAAARRHGHSSSKRACPVSRWRRKLDKLGMRGSPPGELVFQNVDVPASNVLGNVKRRRPSLC